jgi:hypothetical protein
LVAKFFFFFGDNNSFFFVWYKVITIVFKFNHSEMFGPQEK